MLTREAFNALLKTMEEPPAHVKFILCTTEPHKVPATIQSRCQRFDFKPISTRAIAEHLSVVIEGEKLEADGELVHAVAKLGNGSMRDALSILDRLLAAGQRRLTTDLLNELLGLPEREAVDGLVDAIAAGDVKGALEAVDGLLREGSTPELLLETLADRFRDLLILCTCGSETELVDLSEEARGREAARAARFDAGGLTHLIALCDATGRNLRTSSAGRALLDAGVARMAMTEQVADLAGMVAASNGQPRASERGAGSGPGRGGGGHGAKKR